MHNNVLIFSLAQETGYPERETIKLTCTENDNAFSNQTQQPDKNCKIVFFHPDDTFYNLTRNESTVSLVVTGVEAGLGRTVFVYSGNNQTK